MTIQDYSKISGLNVRKIYKYSKYKSWYNSRIKSCCYSELPICMQVTINQILTNLNAIKKGEVHHQNDIALKKSGFKLTSIDFQTNILGSSKRIDDKKMSDIIDLGKIDLLISITETFINKKK